MERVPRGGWIVGVKGGWRAGADLTGRVGRGWYPRGVVRRRCQSWLCRRLNGPPRECEGAGVQGVFALSIGSAGLRK
jgi:hypothetical protein